MFVSENWGHDSLSERHANVYRISHGCWLRRSRTLQAQAAFSIGFRQQTGTRIPSLDSMGFWEFPERPLDRILYIRGCSSPLEACWQHNAGQLEPAHALYRACCL